MWPEAVAPFTAVILNLKQGSSDTDAACEALYRELEAKGVDVLYDDRVGKVSPGVKFKDAELIGVPTIVVVGKSLAEGGTVEVRDRRSGAREDVHADQVVDHLVRLVRS